MATNASEIAGAITDRDAEPPPLPKAAKVSNILTTVPNNPINGEVEAIIDRVVKPLVELV